MFTEEQRAEFYAPVLTVLKKSDGTEVEPIIDCSAGFFICELIDDELYLRRNAIPEELDAYYKREEQRAVEAEKEKERKAAERAEMEKIVHSDILSTIKAHADGKFRLLEPAKERTYAFETAEDAADFASWNVERDFECAPEPEVEPEPVVVAEAKEADALEKQGEQLAAEAQEEAKES
jgi:hypothetical protein